MRKLGQLLLHSIGIINFDISIGRAVVCGILMLILVGLRVRYIVQNGIWVTSQKFQ
jgi:hypothetical protein